MSGRFDWVADGKAFGPNPKCDADLWRDPRGAVVPSIGAIVPYWALIIPRRLAPSFRACPLKVRSDCFELAKEVAEQFPKDRGTPVFFEHGALGVGSKIGCGVDHAHLHAVMLDFDLLKNLVALDQELSWHSITSDDPWAEIPADKDYYLFISEQKTLWAPVLVSTSQFFRRAIARGVNKSGEWDYRVHPNYAHVKATKNSLTARLAHRVPPMHEPLLAQLI